MSIEQNEKINNDELSSLESLNYSKESQEQIIDTIKNMDNGFQLSISATKDGMSTLNAIKNA